MAGRSVAVKSLTPKVKMPAGSKAPKRPSMGSATAPNVGNGLKGYISASKMLTSPKPPKNGLGL